jgi:hypothetical protein
MSEENAQNPSQSETPAADGPVSTTNTPSHLPGWALDKPLPGIGQPEPLKKHVPIGEIVKRERESGG